MNHRGVTVTSYQYLEKVRIHSAEFHLAFLRKLSGDPCGVSTFDHHLHDGVFDVFMLGLVATTFTEIVTNYLQLRR